MEMKEILEKLQNQLLILEEKKKLIQQKFFQKLFKKLITVNLNIQLQEFFKH